MMGGGMLGLGLIGFLVSLAVIVAITCGIALLAALLVRQFSSGTTQQGFNPAQVKPIAPSTPRDILQARYTRGEITRDQYQQMLADIE